MQSIKVVTNSERQTFLACRQKYGYRYIDGLRPVITAPALRFGTLVHAGVEQVLKHVQRSVLIGDHSNTNAFLAPSYLDDVAARGIDAACIAYQNESDFVDRDAMDEQVRDARWLVHEYITRHASMFYSQIIVDVEHAFDVTVQRSRKYRYAGKVDSLWLDTENKKVIIEDIKTTQSKPEVWGERVELDTQMRGYAYALLRDKDLLRETFQRHAVDLTEYDVVIRWVLLRKHIPSEPRVLKNGDVSTDKRQYTTRPLYEAALVVQEKNGKPRSSEQVAFLETLPAVTDCYSVIETEVTGDEMSRWLSELMVTLKEMQLVSKDPKYRVRNMNACTGPGMRCEYRSICVSEVVPGPHWHGLQIFRKVDDPHEELCDSDDTKDMEV